MCPRTFYAHSRPDAETDHWQELRLHLDSVSAITSRLAGKIRLSHAGELIGLAHDLGKYSEAFQQYLQKVASDAPMEMEPDFSLKGSVDHSTAGAQIIGDGLPSGNGGIASQMRSVFCDGSEMDCQFLPLVRIGIWFRMSVEGSMPHGSAPPVYALLQYSDPIDNLIHSGYRAEDHARHRFVVAP